MVFRSMSDKITFEKVLHRSRQMRDLEIFSGVLASVTSHRVKLSIALYDRSCDN